jgi:hypothetical protein
MTRLNKIALFVVVIFLTALACALPGGNSSSSDPNVLFQDDFSSTDSGWEQISRDETGITDYDQGGFRIQVLQPHYDYWVNPGLSFTDVSIEADAKKIGGPEDNDFGLICRYSDANNFYVFLAASDGYFAIGKYTNDNFEIIGGDYLQETDTVKSGDATNHLRADCVGSTLTMYINGTQVQQVTDSEHTSGDVGLIASTYDTSGTDILFDNFIVRKP